MCDAAPLLKDFADTAAAIASLDVVVTVDSAVAHLAGAMGVPCWLLLPRVGVDWRWMETNGATATSNDANELQAAKYGEVAESSGTPWYASVRCVRQATPENWSAPVAVIGRALAELVAERAPVVSL